MKKIVALTAVALLAGPAAYASDISENLYFTLSGFVNISPGSTTPPPITTITGSITANYDPSLSYNNDTTDLVVHYLTGITNISSPLGFTYQNGYLEFGGILNNADEVFSNTDDLVVAFNVTNPADPTFVPCSTPGYTCGTYTGSALVDAAGYTQVGYPTGWFYGVPQSVVTTTPPTSTPEPATLGLLGLGLAGVGFVRRKQRRSFHCPE